MTDYEKKILRHLNGEDVPDLSWGAAMGEAIGFLKGDGYVRRVGNKYEITDAGRAALKAAR